MSTLHTKQQFLLDDLKPNSKWVFLFHLTDVKAIHYLCASCSIRNATSWNDDWMRYWKQCALCVSYFDLSRCEMQCQSCALIIDCRSMARQKLHQIMHASTLSLTHSRSHACSHSYRFHYLFSTLVISSLTFSFILFAHIGWLSLLLPLFVLFFVSNIHIDNKEFNYYIIDYG